MYGSHSIVNRVIREDALLLNIDDEEYLDEILSSL